MRVLNALMVLLFLFAVVVQYNDPDPLRWMAIYGAAALACFLAFRGRLPRWIPALVGIVALVWTATIAPGIVPAALAHMFDEFEMHSTSVEEAREATGLLIVAVWMLLLLLTRARQFHR